MPANYQFGSEHYLIVATTQVGGTGDYNRPLALLGRPSDTPEPAVHVNDAHWVAYDNIRDVSESGSGNTVNITTRDEARRGLSVEVTVTKTGQLTFAVRYRAKRLLNDPTYQALMYAALKREEIAMADLDGPMTTVGSQGQVGNYTLTYSLDKPVEGVVIANFTANLTSYPDRVEVASVAAGVPTFTIL